MRFFLSALLLALASNRKNSKCSNGEELTNSYIPAGLQVLNHYVLQIQQSFQQDNLSVDAGKNRRNIQDAVQSLGWGVKRNLNPESAVVLPIIEVTYNMGYMNNTSNGTITNETILKLEDLASALDGEAKDQNLAVCRGLSSRVVMELEKTSKTSSIEQLAAILRNIISGEVRRPDTRKWIKEVLIDLDNNKSNLNKDLKFVKPLRYLSDVSKE